MRFLYLLLLMPFAVRAANPAFQDFNLTQFSTNGNKIAIKSSANVTNLLSHGTQTNSSIYGDNILLWDGIGYFTDELNVNLLKANNAQFTNTPTVNGSPVLTNANSITNGGLSANVLPKALNTNSLGDSAFSSVGTNGALVGDFTANGVNATNFVRVNGVDVLTNAPAQVFTNDAGVIHETSAATRFHITNLVDVDTGISNSVSLGANQNWNGSTNSVVIGNGAHVTMAHSVVIGNNATNYGGNDGGVVIGHGAATGGDSVSIGIGAGSGTPEAKLRDVTLIGYFAGFAMTANQTANATLIGEDVGLTSSGNISDSVVIGGEALYGNAAKVEDSTFIGAYVANSGTANDFSGTVAIGKDVLNGNGNDAYSSVFIGNDAGGHDSVDIFESVSIGRDSAVGGNGSVAIGFAATTTGTNGAAFGANAASSGDNEYVFGTALNSYTFPGTGGAAFAVTPTVNGSSVLTNAGITISQNGTNGAPAINFTNTATVTWARSGSNWTATAVGSSGAANVSVNGTNVSTANFTDSSQLSYQVSGSNITATVAAAPANGISPVVVLTTTGTNVDASQIDWNATNVCYSLLLTNNAFFGASVCINVPNTTSFKWIQLDLIQDGTGGRTVTFTNSIYAGVNGTFPITTTAGAWDSCTLINSRQTNGNIVVLPSNNLHR